MLYISCCIIIYYSRFMILLFLLFHWSLFWYILMVFVVDHYFFHSGHWFPLMGCWTLRNILEYRLNTSKRYGCVKIGILIKDSCNGEIMFWRMRFWTNYSAPFSDKSMCSHFGILMHFGYGRDSQWCRWNSSAISGDLIAWISVN